MEDSRDITEVDMAEDSRETVLGEILDEGDWGRSSKLGNDVGVRILFRFEECLGWLRYTGVVGCTEPSEGSLRGGTRSGLKMFGRI